MADKNNTKVITRAAEKGKRGAVRQHSKRRPVVYTGPSIFDDLASDRRAELDAIRAERAAMLAKKRAERQAEFAAAHLEYALVAPQITNDRKSGGVEGYARTLAVRLVEGWSDASNEDASKIGASRLVLARKRLVSLLLDEYTADEQKKADAGEVLVTDDEVKAKAAERLAKVERVLAVAERAARGALDYGFAKAKEAELVSSSTPAAVTASAPKPGPALFARA